MSLSRAWLCRDIVDESRRGGGRGNRKRADKQVDNKPRAGQIPVWEACRHTEPEQSHHFPLLLFQSRRSWLHSSRTEVTSAYKYGKCEGMGQRT
ncbi:hypothetical protein PGIGA_G00034520 [Pangasianodon gigas]|uniref:Uncharacterized protein n=1 Tax=Pangasianodon gigas TaxID=30993 RepID=A0ACC5WZD2_PANGG|nr:hypothetical protein [Pangasianodon gigas]